MQDNTVIFDPFGEMQKVVNDIREYQKQQSDKTENERSPSHGMQSQ